MSEIVDIEPLMRGLYEEMQTGGENYSTQSVYEMIEKETSKVEVFTKADMVDMLTELQLEIEDLKNEPACCHHFERGIKYSSDIIQQKIDELKENKI